MKLIKRILAFTGYQIIRDWFPWKLHHYMFSKFWATVRKIDQMPFVT